MRRACRRGGWRLKRVGGHWTLLVEPAEMEACSRFRPLGRLDPERQRETSDGDRRPAGPAQPPEAPGPHTASPLNHGVLARRPPLHLLFRAWRLAETAQTDRRPGQWGGWRGGSSDSGWGGRWVPEGLEGVEGGRVGLQRAAQTRGRGGSTPERPAADARTRPPGHRSAGPQRCPRRKRSRELRARTPTVPPPAGAAGRSAPPSLSV